MDIDAIYFAGFFDGEGCIRLNKRLKKGKYIEYAPFITVGQKEGATLDWIKENFGGRVYKIKADGSYVWIATNKVALTVLKRITPFLKYKKPQADLIFEFYENTVQGSFIREKEHERRELIMQKLKAEKKIFAPSLHVSERQQRLNESAPKGDVIV